MRIDSIFSWKTERNKQDSSGCIRPLQIIIAKNHKKEQSAGNYTSDTTVEEGNRKTNK